MKNIDKNINKNIDKVAKEVLALIKQSEYTFGSQLIQFVKEQKLAEQETKLYTPKQCMLINDIYEEQKTNGNSNCKIVVTEETTQVAAHRLVVKENINHLVLLNFASGRNPGGGFLKGSKSQEEDLCRCSGLYNCLITKPSYYSYNRKRKTPLYSNHTIYSPNVPWFRKDSSEEPNDLFFASVITSPAPNAGQLKNKKGQSEIEKVLRQRANIILAMAQHYGHKHLLLGAWGCGAFGNNPIVVADIFKELLENTNAFDYVTFAIYCPTEDKSILKVFQEKIS